MARASTRTWLPLDRWAEIMGINPLHFNQLLIPDQPEVCGEAWFQYAWQNANRVGREDVAQAIQLAEQRISAYVGYPLLPDWIEEEDVPTTRPARPEVFSTGYNVRGQHKSVTAEHGYIISGGRKTKEIIEASAAVSLSDEDGDSFDETVTVTVSTDVEACEIHVFFSGRDGEDEWEIRPVTVESSGGTATITFKVWQIVQPSLQEGVQNITALDATDSVYESSVDVYRVYNDPSEQALLIWKGEEECDCGSDECDSCNMATQAACLTVRNSRLGFFTYQPATWNADTESFDYADFSVARDPDIVRLWYLAGWQDQSQTCPTARMDPFWEKVVAYYAASLLDRGVCACENVSNFIEHWREDLAEQTESGAHQISFTQVANLFGTTRGALYAYNACQGKRVAK